MRNLTFIFFLILFIFTSSKPAISESSSQRDLVYLCSHPSVKCYYKGPCRQFFKVCTDSNSKIIKVSESRARAIGKEECECEK